MNFPYPELIGVLDEYNKVLAVVQSKAIFVRDINLQKEQISKVELIISKLDVLKTESAIVLNDKKANFLLCLVFSAKAVKQELLMIINLKEDKNDIAWDCLVEAQDLISAAIRNHPFNGDYLIGFGEKLRHYEILLFPKMQFFSSGYIVGKTECSICKQNYNDCDHIKGKAYMGMICQEVVLEIIDFEEISSVDNPKDKKCRVISFSENGKKYDIFTHRELTDRA